EVAVFCAVSVHGIEWPTASTSRRSCCACSALLGEWANGGAQSSIAIWLEGERERRGDLAVGTGVSRVDWGQAKERQRERRQ
uniref:Uncharacterized protein n=1 Tax=Triticum urartu TaxID=4572 RepID=A0A8R7PDU2_TRIUA